MTQTRISNYQIKDFYDIFFIEGNVRFKLLLYNGMKVPPDLDMTLNINQIDSDAQERLRIILEGLK